MLLGSQHCYSVQWQPFGIQHSCSVQWKASGIQHFTVCSQRHLGSQHSYSVQWHAFGMSAFLHKVGKWARRISEKLLKQPAWSTQCSSGNNRRDPVSKQTPKTKEPLVCKVLWSFTCMPRHAWTHRHTDTHTHEGGRGEESTLKINKNENQHFYYLFRLLPSWGQVYGGLRIYYFTFFSFLIRLTMSKAIRLEIIPLFMNYI